MNRLVAATAMLFLMSAISLSIRAQEAPAPNTELKDAQYYIKCLLDQAKKVTTITAEYQCKSTTSISSPRSELNGGGNFEQNCTVRATKDKSCINSVESSDPMARHTSVITKHVTYDLTKYQGEPPELDIERTQDAIEEFSPPEEVAWFFPYWDLAEKFGGAADVVVNVVTTADGRRLIELLSDGLFVQLDPEKGLLPVVIREEYGLSKEEIHAFPEISDELGPANIVSRSISRYEVTEAQLMPNGVYCPKRLTFMTQDESGDGTRCVTRDEVSVILMKFNDPLPDSVFKVDLVEGMHVTETVGDESTEYRVGPNGQRIPESTESTIET